VTAFGRVRAAGHSVMSAWGARAVWEVLMEIEWVEGVYLVGGSD